MIEINARFCLVFGAIVAMLSVLLGAFGAHALKGLLSPDMVAVYDTALRYQMFHSLGLLVLGILMQGNKLSSQQTKHYKTSAFFFLLGLVIFCGSLYALALSELVLGARMRILGAITPIGGFGFILGWLYLTLAAKATSQEDRS